MKIKVTQYYSFLCLGTVLLSPLFSNGQIKSSGNGTESGSEISQLNFTINSPLLAGVDRQIQDSVIERIKMDTNPNIEHYKNTAQLIIRDIPSIDFSSLQFVPVIASPQTIEEKKNMDILSINKNRAFILGKNREGQDIYINAQYKIENIDTISSRYKELSEVFGKENMKDHENKVENRKGIDNWNIYGIYKSGDILYQIIDYARNESDNGRFFILTKGEHHFEICYFKDGKPMSCRMSDQNDAIRVRPFEELIR